MTLMYRISWSDELQQLEDRGWLSWKAVHKLRQILLQTTQAVWEDEAKAAEDYLTKIATDTVKRHPNFFPLVSLLAFGKILEENGHKKESGDAGYKLQEEVSWIERAFQDEENPFPFDSMGEVQMQHKVIEENIKILDRFLKSI